MKIVKRILLSLCTALMLSGCGSSGNPELYQKLMSQLNARIVQQSQYLEQYGSENQDNVKLFQQYAVLAKERGMTEKVEFAKDDPRLKDLVKDEHKADPLPQDSLESLNESQAADVENTIKVNQSMDGEVANLNLVRAQNVWFKQEIEKMKATKPQEPAK